MFRPRLPRCNHAGISVLHERRCNGPITGKNIFREELQNHCKNHLDWVRRCLPFSWHSWLLAVFLRHLPCDPSALCRGCFGSERRLWPELTMAPHRTAVAGSASAREADTMAGGGSRAPARTARCGACALGQRRGRAQGQLRGPCVWPSMLVAAARPTTAASGYRLVAASTPWIHQGCPQAWLPQTKVPRRRLRPHDPSRHQRPRAAVGAPRGRPASRRQVAPYGLVPAAAASARRLLARLRPCARRPGPCAARTPDGQRLRARPAAAVAYARPPGKGRRFPNDASSNRPCPLKG